MTSPSEADKKRLRTCLVCGRKFLGWFSEKYCSDECRVEGRRVKDRKRKQKSRKIVDLKEGALAQELGEMGLGDHSYPMYNHEVAPTMYANASVYNARDGKKHVRSYYDLLRDIAKLNPASGLYQVISQMAPRESND